MERCFDARDLMCGATDESLESNVSGRGEHLPYINVRYEENASHLPRIDLRYTKVRERIT